MATADLYANCTLLYSNKEKLYIHKIYKSSFYEDPTCGNDRSAPFSELCDCSKQGLTFHVVEWPTVSNNWAGKWSYSGGNPYNGDQLCTSYLPILCILGHKKMPRPWYNYSVTTPHASYDGGFYNGWTGGFFSVSKPIQGSSITSQLAGDGFCSASLGAGWQMAEFHMGYWISWMNNGSIKAWDSWNWNSAYSGGWNFWGYFGTDYSGRAWTWINDQASGNCN